MKSLDERKKFRLKQRAENAKNTDQREADPNGQETVETVSDILAKSIPEIAAKLKTLSDEQLSELEAAENAGKKRAGVNDAISAEKKSRVANSGGWNANAG